MTSFSFTRWWAIVLKEFLQLRRDRLTFGMIVGVPIVYLILFGYAINTDPKHLRTAIVSADHSEFTRSFLAAMRTSEYFEIVGVLPGEEAARRALARGEVQFVLNIPADFTRRLLRAERPALLLEADATNPSVLGTAVASVRDLVTSVARKDLTGPLASIAGRPAAFDVLMHRLYNPENLTQHNIVPGLMGVILTMTMVMMTGLAMTRERERGTMENILATPVVPLEVMTGKIVPYIAIGLIQSTIILLAAYFVFHVPFLGSLVTVYLGALIFVAANLTVGITLSSLAQNQLQPMASGRETIHGIPAAIASFQAQTQQGVAVAAYVAFLRHEGRTYQVVTYAPAQVFGQVDATLQEIIGSFAPLTNREILGIQPPKLEIVRVDEPMTLAEFDRRHPSAFTLELDAPTIRIHGKAFHATQPVHVEMRDDVLIISPLAVIGDEGWLNARGQIAYHGDVDIDVKGRIPLAVLLPGPGLITGVNGHGRLEMKLSGRLEAPRYTGWLRVEKGDLRFVDHPEFIGGINGQVRFQGWKIQIPGVEGRWAGGTVKLTGDASHIRGKGWRWVADLRLDTADAKRVFTREEKGKGRVTGRTDFTGQLTAEGGHREELRRSVQGKLRLDLKDGKFEQYTVLANIVRILNLTPDPTSGVPYDFLKAVFSLRGGVAETQDLLFISDTMRVGGVGKIDLGRGEVDMLLGVQPLRTVDRLIRGTQLHKVPLLGRLLFGEEGSVLVVSMKVKGPLEAPEVSVVPLESVGRGIFGIFRRILELPGGLSPAESSGRREK